MNQQDDYEKNYDDIEDFDSFTEYWNIDHSHLLEDIDDDDSSNDTVII